MLSTTHCGHPTVRVHLCLLTPSVFGGVVQADNEPPKPLVGLVNQRAPLRFGTLDIYVLNRFAPALVCIRVSRPTVILDLTPDATSMTFISTEGVISGRDGPALCMVGCCTIYDLTEEGCFEAAWPLEVDKEQIVLGAIAPFLKISDAMNCPRSSDGSESELAAGLLDLVERTMSMRINEKEEKILPSIQMWWFGLSSVQEQDQTSPTPRINSGLGAGEIKCTMPAGPLRVVLGEIRVDNRLKAVGWTYRMKRARGERSTPGVRCVRLYQDSTVKVRNNWTNPGRSAPYPSVSLVIVTKRFDGRRLEVEFRFLLNGRGAVRKVPAAIFSLKTRIANIIRSSPVHT